MRIASILAATAAIGWLFCVLWDLPVSRSLLFYTGWLGVITLTAVFVAQRIPQNERSYAIFYTLMLGPLVLFTIVVALEFALSLGRLGLSGFLIFMFLGAWFIRLLTEYVPDTFVTKVMLAQGYFFCVCGFLALASAIPPCTALQFRLRLMLGLYWLAVSAYSFAQSIGSVRSRALFESLASWFASALCVVFLGSLAWQLMGIQPEFGRQHAQDEQAATEIQHLEAM